jgi:hypothetical protein
MTNQASILINQHHDFFRSPNAVCQPASASLQRHTHPPHGILVVEDDIWLVNWSGRRKTKIKKPL